MMMKVQTLTKINLEWNPSTSSTGGNSYGVIHTGTDAQYLDDGFNQMETGIAGLFDW